MTQLLHSLPWTLALALAAQGGEGEAARIPDLSAIRVLESTLNPGAEDSQEVDQDAQEADLTMFRLSPLSDALLDEES